MDIQPIATILNDYTDKFAVPRQSGLADIESRIILESPYNDENAVRGIEGYSHLWLIWGFSKNLREAHPLTVRPPRLGGNVRMGVFATRSPFRPNNLGLSSVRLERVEYDEQRHPVLIVSGADLINGTPIFDIKPYIRFTDAHKDAVSGIADSVPFHHLEVVIPTALEERIPDEKRETLRAILKDDPRPAYQQNNERQYGFSFADKEIQFKVEGNTLTVTNIL